MSEQTFPPLKDDCLSAAMLKIAAQWAVEIWPFGEGDPEVVIRERIRFMAIALEKLQGAMGRPEAGFKF